MEVHDIQQECGIGRVTEEAFVSLECIEMD
jgi:hypothetical protein